MEKRKFEKLGIETSLLGFGCMRFPATPDGKIDEPRAEKLLDRAIAAGVNYIDTAYPYHNGDSEPFVGKVLQKYDRNSFYLATKLPVWAIESVDDAKRIFAEQLERLRTDHIDFYLMHAMSKERWDKVKELGIVEFCEQLKAEGKIRYLGFSFHDTYEAFEEVLRGRDWDFCQIQLNYIDTKYQAGLEGLKYAADKGLAVSIMEPLRGGYLANVPDAVQKVFDGTGKSAVEWGLDYLWNRPEVSVVLSGMGSEEQIKQNIEFASRSHAGMFSPADEKVIEKAQEIFASYDTIPCTGCSYCLPCPKGVGIPYNFVVYNNYQTNNNYEQEKERYESWVTMFGKQASECVSCHTCESICPQHINIAERLAKVAETFSK